MPERQKVALVTGASSGIGYATAIEFAKRGYKVFAGARRLEPMQKLKDDHGVIIFKLDVSDLESVKNAKNSLNQKLAQIIWTSYTTMLVNRVLSLPQMLLMHK